MKINQKGRSMVEMLGVLAIIGVLSAGALAGYSKAMFRHKVNQTIDTFSLAMERVMELDQMDLGREIRGAEDIKAYGIVPNCQKAPDEWSGSEGCKLPIGILDLDFDFDSTEGRMEGEFYLTLHNSKECIAFLSAGWENVMPEDWWNPQGFIGFVSGDNRFYNSDRPITINKITDACAECDENGVCRIQITVRAEI